MNEQFAEMIVGAAGIYLGIGVVIALLFSLFGVARIDAAAKGASLLFRPMIFPGCVLLWPFVVPRWLSFRRINEQNEASS